MFYWPKWYVHNPESIPENEKYKILLFFLIFIYLFF